MRDHSEIYRPEIYKMIEDAPQGSLTKESLLQRYMEETDGAEIIRFHTEEISKANKAILDGNGDTSELINISHTSSRAIHRLLSAQQYTQFLLSRFGYGHLGSARLRENDEEYQSTYNIAERATTLGNGLILPVTGGGPGLMEAANKGANMAGAMTHGLTINLPFEPDPNDFLSAETFHASFGSRLTDFSDRTMFAHIDVGGFGTDLERAWFFQEKQVQHLPEDYTITATPNWEEVVNVLIEQMHDQRDKNGKKTLISPKDREIVTKYSDKEDEIVDAIDKAFQVWKKKIHSKLKKSER